MPLTGYLIVPDVGGESRAVDHEDEIEIFDISWGLEHLRSASVGRLRSRARTDVGPLTIRKHYDASSPYLADAVERGKSFREIVVALNKQTSNAHLDYLVITMENAIINSYAFGINDDSDDILTEEIEIDFEYATIKYTVHADDGTAAAEHEVRIGS
jgi:type VI secretion system secreted protein Hcp